MVRPLADPSQLLATVAWDSLLDSSHEWSDSSAPRADVGSRRGIWLAAMARELSLSPGGIQVAPTVVVQSHSSGDGRDDGVGRRR
jgi:hypothetical protein